jgi:hypothetical protein
MKPDDRYAGSDYEEWEDDSERVQKIRKAHGAKELRGKRVGGFSMGAPGGERDKRPRRVRRPDKF